MPQREPMDDDEPWLREMVDDELLGLFSSEVEEVRRTARNLLLRAPDDPVLLDGLIEALRASLERLNDDTQASQWMALILAEIGDRSAFPVLILGLGSEDEPLQEASRDALLRMGPPAIDALLEELDEEPGPELADAGYRLLGYVGSLGDPQLRERAMDFLLGRVERELVKPPGEIRIESLFQASALLGDRRMLQKMDLVLRERFKGKNSAIQDAREMLAENEPGQPLVYDSPPWMEEHRWLFEENLEESRVNRKPGAGREEEEPDAFEDEEVLGDDLSEASDEPPPEGEKNISRFYWGLSATLDRQGRGPIDARRFLTRPGKPKGEEEVPEEPEEDAGEEDDETGSEGKR